MWQQTEKQLFSLLLEGAQLAVEDATLDESVLTNMRLSSNSSHPSLTPASFTNRPHTA